MPELKHSAQIVFLVDATGSMEPCIKRLGENIHAFMEALSTESDHVDWQARVVGFRDTEVDRESDWFVGLESHPFVTDPVPLKSQIMALQAKGGGIGDKEIPETGLDALWAVANRDDWDPIGDGHRVIVLLSDAPTKSIVTDNVADPPLSHTDDVQEVAQLLAVGHFKALIFALDCPGYSQLGKLPGSDFFDVAAGGSTDRYLGLESLDFDRVIEIINKTVTGQVAPPSGGGGQQAKTQAPQTQPGQTTGAPPTQPGGTTPGSGSGPSTPPGGTIEA